MTDLSQLTQQAHAGARTVVRRTAPALRTLARLGYASRGCIYCLIGTLAAMAGAGAAGGRVTDTRGALQTIVGQPFGRVILAIVAVGFFAFAIWLFVQAIEDPDQRGDGWRGFFGRTGSFLGALGYLSLMVSAIHVLFGHHVYGGEHAARDWSAWAMSWPLGRWAVAIVGIVVIIVGCVQMYASFKHDIGRLLDRQRLTGRARAAAVALGRVGIASRGMIFCLIGAFLALAAWHANPREARGLAGAFHYLERQPYGPWLLAVVAAGFVAYGAFEFIEARYRRIEPA
jgi:hypothetical protein